MATTKKKTLNDFRAAHDKSFAIPAKIKAALESLGKDSWEYEAEFMRRVGVGTGDFARFRDKFDEFCVSVPGNGRSKRVWAGSKALADKMREMT